MVKRDIFWNNVIIIIFPPCSLSPSITETLSSKIQLFCSLVVAVILTGLGLSALSHFRTRYDIVLITDYETASVPD